jgi:hypothetical protein
MPIAGLRLHAATEHALEAKAPSVRANARLQSKSTWQVCDVDGPAHSQNVTADWIVIPRLPLRSISPFAPTSILPRRGLPLTPFKECVQSCRLRNDALIPMFRIFLRSLITTNPHLYRQHCHRPCQDVI